MNWNLIFEIFAWTAVAVISVSYWLQLFKIHRHKEVRDLSLISYSVLFIGYSFLFIEGLISFSILGIAKSVAVLIPCALTIFMIQHNKHCEWVDEDGFKCQHCGKSLQPHHLYCSSCGTSVVKSQTSK